MKSKSSIQTITYENGSITKIYAGYIVEHKGIESVWHINTDWFSPEPDENPYWKVDFVLENKIKLHLKRKFIKFVKTFGNNFVVSQ